MRGRKAVSQQISVLAVQRAVAGSDSVVAVCFARIKKGFTEGKLRVSPVVRQGRKCCNWRHTSGAGKTKKQWKHLEDL
jgi:hypothetical protein